MKETIDSTRSPGDLDTIWRNEPGPLRIKVCGLTREADVLAAVGAGADAVGFILYAGSARHVSAERAAELARLLPPLVTPVLLFVNATDAEVLAAAALVPGALLQFHGDESANRCAALAHATGRPFWRAARIPTTPDPRFDLLEFVSRNQAAQAILLDTHVAGYGGSGKPFDWSSLPAHIPAHLVLSGGLTPENVVAAAAALRGRGKSLALDVSSGVEASDADGLPIKGIKDHVKILRFIAAARTAASGTA